MSKCSNCGRNMDRMQKARLSAMQKALSMTEKIRNNPALFRMIDVSAMIQKIDNAADVDLPTLKELTAKGWCIDCILKRDK